MSVVWYIVVLVVIAAAIAYVAYNYQRIRKMPEGTEACFVRVDQNKIWWVRGDAENTTV